MDLGNVKKGFGAEVRRRRNHLGFSQEELAERANLHRTYVSDVEAGKRNPSLESIQRLAQALGASIGSVFAALEAVTPAPPIQAHAKHPRDEESVQDILLVEDNPRDVELALGAFRAAKLANRVRVLRDGSKVTES